MISYTDVSKAISDIIALSKKLKNHELTNQVWNLQQMLMELMAENTRLHAQLSEAQMAKDFSKTAVYRDGKYWLPNDETPFCSRCWEADHKIVHLDKSESVGYYCPQDLFQRNLHK